MIVYVVKEDHGYDGVFIDAIFNEREDAIKHVSSYPGIVKDLVDDRWKRFENGSWGNNWRCDYYIKAYEVR